MSASETLLHSPTRQKQQVRGWIMLIGSNVLFAGAYVSGKYALTAVSPVTLNALRFLLASLVLAPILVRHRRGLRMNRADLWTFGIVSLFSFVLNKLFEYLGVNLSTASDSALLISGEGIMTAALAWFFLRERVSVLRVVMLGVGCFGAYLIIERGFVPHIDAGRGGLRILGDALFLLSLAFEAIASIVSKRLSGRFSPLLVTAATVIGSLLVWIPAGALDIGLHGLHLTWLATGGIVYLAIMVTALGYIGWFGGLQLIEGSAAAASLFLQPLIGTLLAVVLLHESLSAFTLLGAICILGSVWILSRPYADPTGV